MPFQHAEINRKLGINLQLEILRTNLEKNERSWIASGLGMIHNTVAASLRQQIVELSATL